MKFEGWRLNVETKTKRALHSSRRLGFNELTNAKNRVLHRSHFAGNRLLADSSSCLANACCCMHSLELLMMDGKTVRNM